MAEGRANVCNGDKGKDREEAERDKLEEKELEQGQKRT